MSTTAPNGSPAGQPLDEAAIAAAAADYSARLARLDAERDLQQFLGDTDRRLAQQQFDHVGLPRGLYFIERVA